MAFDPLPVVIAGAALFYGYLHEKDGLFKLLWLFAGEMLFIAAFALVPVGEGGNPFIALVYGLSALTIATFIYIIYELIMKVF